MRLQVQRVQFVLAGKGQDQPCPHCGFKNDRVAAMTRVKVKNKKK
jgi:glutaredoxin-related protein